MSISGSSKGKTIKLIRNMAYKLTIEVSILLYNREEMSPFYYTILIHETNLSTKKILKII